MLPEDSFIVTDASVDANWQLPSAAPKLVLPPGEATKSLIWLERICGWLAESGASRRSTVVAFGGGVIGDVVGFAAASYMRGIEYIQVPTTLLAQVDSSVGGKVAVDLSQGKNLVGAFHQPKEVHVATDFLSTLSLRQFRNGMAEVVKYGLIMDAGFAQELLNVPPTQVGPMREIVSRCIRYKASVVQEDEFETKGIRAILNFGHTVGHALEQATSYRAMLHGEAISVGMAVEARLGELIGVTPPGTFKLVVELLQANGLPIGSDILTDGETLLTIMKRDKKATKGRLAFSLLNQIGGCKLVEDVRDEDVRRAMREV